MPAARHREPDRRARDVEVHAGDRAEAVVGLLAAQHHLADPAQDRGRRAAADRRGADRVARQRRHRGGLGALALHVADDREPVAVGGREDVVEVAADLVALAGGAVDGAELEARDVGQQRRQQRGLERLGDRRPRAVQARVVDRRRRAQRQVLGQRQVALVEAAARLGADERDRADRAVAHAHRRDHRRARCRSSRMSAQVLLALRAGHDHLVGDLRVRAASARCGSPGGRAEVSRVGRELAPQPLGQRDLLGVGVRDRDLVRPRRRRRAGRSRTSRRSPGRRAAPRS